MGKRYFLFFLLTIVLIQAFGQSVSPQKKVIVITTDGLRWQEVFKGLDTAILKMKSFQKGDSIAAAIKYGGFTDEERRNKLMPFFWSTIAKNGEIHGNRTKGSNVDNANPYWFSYPGYSEILTGQVDTAINSNEYKPNPNTNFFEYLNSLPFYKNKVAAYGAWDAFKRILNERRALFPVINGNQIDSSLLKHSDMKFLSKIMAEIYQPFGKDETLDVFIKFQAMHYLKTKKPNALYVSMGETDELAHAGNYPAYLDAIHRFDKLLKEVLDFVATDPEYKGNTIILITTDHGRGDLNKMLWTSHGAKTAGSHEIWYAMIGAGVQPIGEVDKSEQVYQKELIHKVAALMNLHFTSVKKY